ncbi:MAG: DNA helicase RecG, partial [Fusobacteriaceae bacterium]|nr:DNA helicase RecG [Fusobacteriaceae bacterium]
MEDNLELYKGMFDKVEGLHEKVLKKFKLLGLNSYFDVLYNFPRTYEDRTNIKSIGEIRNEEFVLVKAMVIKAGMTTTSNRRKLFKAKISDGTGYMELTWFGMPYVKEYVVEGKEMLFIGLAKRGFGWQITNPEFKVLKDDEKVKAELLPIYALVHGVSQNDIRKYTKWVIINKIKELQENIPEEILKKYGIVDRQRAMRYIHFPKNEKELEEAKRRFAIEELLLLQFGILKSKYLLHKTHEIYTLNDNKNLVKKFLENLHFSLTSAQKRVITEVHKDLSGGKVVNRLIQGDVGSGKTIVA